jgi:hypothetical protein
MAALYPSIREEQDNRDLRPKKESPMFFPFLNAPFPPFQTTSDGESRVDSPFSAFEAWTGALE